MPSPFCDADKPRRFVGCLLAALLLAACGASGPAASAKPTINIGPPEGDIYVGSTVTYFANVIGAAPSEVRWASSIGTIDQYSGVFTAPMTPGTGVVTASLNSNSGVSANVSVDVVPMPQPQIATGLWYGNVTSLNANEWRSWQHLNAIVLEDGTTRMTIDPEKFITSRTEFSGSVSLFGTKITANLSDDAGTSATLDGGVATATSLSGILDTGNNWRYAIDSTYQSPDLRDAGIDTIEGSWTAPISNIDCPQMQLTIDSAGAIDGGDLGSDPSCRRFSGQAYLLDAHRGLFRISLNDTYGYSSDKHQTFDLLAGLVAPLDGGVQQLVVLPEDAFPTLTRQ